MSRNYGATGTASIPRFRYHIPRSNFGARAELPALLTSPGTQSCETALEARFAVFEKRQMRARLSFSFTVRTCTYSTSFFSLGIPHERSAQASSTFPLDR